MKFIKENEIYILKYFVTVLVVTSLAVVFLGFFYIYKNDLIGISSYFKNKTGIGTTTQEPQKTDFGAKAPTDFPTDIPIEKDAKVEQSYGLNYIGQKQLTIVFLSRKTVKENYTLYSNFLEKQNWTISNKYESPRVSSIYGIKEGNDINVTISESALTDTTSKSNVSISILKK